MRIVRRTRRPVGSRRPDAAAGSQAGAQTQLDAPAREIDSPAFRRWRTLLERGPTVLADGAMGTMLFANGLQFGDPPEVWNVTAPDVVRRIQRGYLEAGSQILLTNTVRF